MQLRTGTPVVVAVAALLQCPIAHAEQFVLADVTYTHSTATTSDSHYYPTLPANTPADWTAPVDYAHGSVHIVLDVMTKPAGGAPTKLQVCFEGTPSYACTLQSPTYTTTGRVEWDSPFSSFWYESTVDWSQGTKKMPLILKDDMNNKPHGNPSYMPTDLHVQVTLVSAGSTFMPPPAAGSGGSAGAAGLGGEGGDGGGAGGAGGDDRAQSGSGGGAATAGTSASGAGGAGGAAGGGSAGTMGSRPSAGAGGAGAQAPNGSAGASASGAAGMPALPASSAGAGATAGNDDARGGGASGCRTAGSARGSIWPLFAVIAGLALRRRRSSGV